MTEYTITIRGFESGLTEEGVEAQAKDMVGHGQEDVEIDVRKEAQDD
jgi:hypothetical protein